MLPILATAIIFVVFGIGDMIATKTKAILSMLFVASIVFLLGFWTGIFPTTMFQDSTILAVAGICVSMLMVHLGTIIKLQDFIQQWKTVIVAFAACVGIGVGVFLIGKAIVGHNYAMVAAPILAGGVVATLIMGEAAAAAGLPDLAVFATLVMVTQGFVGYPVASLCLKAEAKRLKKLSAEGKLSSTEEAQLKASQRKKLIPPIPEKYNGSNVIIAKVALVAVLSTYVTTGINTVIANAGGRPNFLSALVICLILGVLFKEIGFLDEDSFTKAKAIGLVMPIITLSIFTNLASATPDMVAGMLLPLLLCVLLGTIFFMGFSILVGKIFKYSWQMSAAIGSTCFFGFPGTYILSNEVADAYSDGPEERKMILDRILPNMLIAGMVTVSITSILIAALVAGIGFVA